MSHRAGAVKRLSDLRVRQ